MMGPWAISGAAPARRPARALRGRPGLPRRRPAVVARRPPPDHPPRRVSPTLVRALLVHGEDAGPRPRPSPRCGSSARPASRGTRTRGAGSSRSSAAAACRSSTTPAGPRSPAGSSAATLLRPIRPTSFNGPCVGMAADVVDAAGRPVRGAVGELALRAPWPGMTRGFWGEPGDERYLEAYWRRIPGPVDPRRLGARPTPTATGTSTAAPTTRSRSPASGSARPRSRRAPSPIRRCSRRPRSASPTSSRARRSSSCACPGPASRGTRPRHARSPSWSSTTSASRSARRPSSPSPTCLGPGAARSCAGSPAPRGSALRPGRHLGPREPGRGRGDRGRRAIRLTSGPCAFASDRPAALTTPRVGPSGVRGYDPGVRPKTR